MTEVERFNEVVPSPDRTRVELALAPILRRRFAVVASLASQKRQEVFSYITTATAGVEVIRFDGFVRLPDGTWMDVSPYISAATAAVEVVVLDDIVYAVFMSWSPGRGCRTKPLPPRDIIPRSVSTRTPLPPHAPKVDDRRRVRLFAHQRRFL